MSITVKLVPPEAKQTPSEPLPEPVPKAIPYIPEPRVDTVVDKVPPEIVMNYPRSGKRVLPAGTTVIDIKQSNVRLPDGTIEEMYTNRRVASCRCFSLYADHMIDIRLSRRGGLLFTSSVFPAWFQKLDMLEFDMVEIECTEPTTFYIVMSEAPDGVPEHYPERWLSPCVSLGYNAADDLVEIRKVINGIMHTRLIDDPDVADKLAVKRVEYGAWTPT